MNADLLPSCKVVTGHGGTGKWTRKKVAGLSCRARRCPRCGVKPMRHKAQGKGEGRMKEGGKGHALMQVRRGTLAATTHKIKRDLPGLKVRSTPLSRLLGGRPRP